MSTHFHLNGFTLRLVLKQRHENLQLGIQAFPVSWDPYFMLVPNNLIPCFCLPIACSLKGIIVFFSVYCHLQQNGRGMYTEPAAGYRYEGTLEHF